MLFWALLATLSILVDLGFTVRRLERYGPRVELNPAVKFAGPGLAVGFLSLSLVVLLCVLDAKALLAAFTGSRLTWNFLQFQGLKLEKELDRIRLAGMVLPPSGTQRSDEH